MMARKKGGGVTFVDWIKGDGISSYILTGIPVKDIEWEFKMRFATKFTIGAYYGGRFHLDAPYLGNFSLGLGPGDHWLNVAPVDNELHTFIMRTDGIAMMDGRQVGVGKLAPIDYELFHNISLLCRIDHNAVPNAYSDSPLYYSTIRDITTSVVLQDLRPAIVDGEYLMYDMVSGLLFRNNGGGIIYGGNDD